MMAGTSPDTVPLTAEVVTEIVSPLTREAAAEILARLPELRADLGSDDAEVQLCAARKIRRVLSVGTCVLGTSVVV